MNKLKILLLVFMMTVVALSACSKKPIINTGVTVGDNSKIIEIDNESKIFITKNGGEYNLFVHRSNDSNPVLILKSMRPLSFPRISKNEKLAVYVTEESGTPRIAVQNTESGLRALPAPVERDLEYLEIGDNNYEVIYKYKDSEPYSFNANQLFTSTNK